MPTDLDRADNLHRAPGRREFKATERPLIVTPTFVSRVDDTSRSKRPQDEGASRDEHGDEVRHPDRHPDALALEPDPCMGRSSLGMSMAARWSWWCATTSCTASRLARPASSGRPIAR